MKMGADLAERKKFLKTATDVVRSQMSCGGGGAGHFAAPREFWESSGKTLCAILRGWTDAELGQAAANAETENRRLYDSIKDVLGEDWLKHHMSGREILVQLAAVGIIAELYH